MAAITGAWEEALKEEFRKDYYKKLYQFIREEYKTKVVYPPSEEIFSAFHLTPLEQVKVVILGQDPYHDNGQAHGLAFSVPDGMKIPPSLRNIYKELASDLNVNPPSGGNLTAWALQGVLMLNTVLTVRAHQAGSHRKKGWEDFTDEVIKAVNENAAHCVFVLWGAPAQNKLPLIDSSRHTVITSAHPSPLSAHRGFLGSRPFSRINAALLAHGQKPIHFDLYDGLL